MHPIYGGKTPEALEHMKRTVAGLFCIVALLLSAVAGVQLTNLVSANPPLINSVVESLELWSQTYGGTGGTNDDLAYSLVETSDGGFALAGGTYSFGAGDCDFWLVKTDANGNMEWNCTYGGTNGDSAHSLVETSDGGLALAGYTQSISTRDYDFGLVRTDPGLIPKPGQSEPPEPFPILLVATASGVSITVLAVCLLYYYKKRLTINP